MNNDNKIYVYIATILSLVAGVLHASIIAFEHVAPLPLETLFFLGGGLAQIILSVVVFKTHRLKYVLPLFVVNGGIAFVWLLTRLLRAPFMNTSEEVGALGLLVFVSEVVALLFLSRWKWLHRHRIKEVHEYRAVHIVAGVFALSLLSGTGVYGSGMLGEIIMPDRTLTHGHAGEDDHDEKGDVHAEEEKGQEKTAHVDEVPHDGNNEKTKDSYVADEPDHVDIIPHQ